MARAEAVWCVVVAGGLGRRFGAEKPKLLFELAGKPLFLWSLIRAAEAGVDGIVLVVPRGFEREFSSAASCVAERIVDVVVGGAERADSVRAGLSALEGVAAGEDIVAIHDGARPLAEAEVFARCIAAAREFGAAIAAVPVADTIKLVEGDEVVETPPRSKLWAAQTPQAFRFDIIKRAYGVPGNFTDDAAAVEAAGGKVRVVLGSRRNIKITTPEDLVIAEALISKGG